MHSRDFIASSVCIREIMEYANGVSKLLGCEWMVHGLILRNSCEFFFRWIRVDHSAMFLFLRLYLNEHRMEADVKLIVLPTLSSPHASARRCTPRKHRSVAFEKNAEPTNCLSCSLSGELPEWAEWRIPVLLRDIQGNTSGCDVNHRSVNAHTQEYIPRSDIT